MRVFHITADQFTELPGLPEQLPPSGYLWLGSARREFEVNTATLQTALQRWTGAQLVDLHVSDLLNNQLPSHFDYTSTYDMLVFRRLAPGSGSSSLFVDDSQGTLSSAKRALEAIDTSPVGFAVFDRVLLTVHPTDCQVRDFFAARLLQMAQGAEARVDQRGISRLPTGTADLMLRMVNHMVDSYLELLGPAWHSCFKADLVQNTPLQLLAAGYADPHTLRRLGKARLSKFIWRHSRGHHGEDLAVPLLEAAAETLRLWDDNEIDFGELADDIAVEARLALALTREIDELERPHRVIQTQLQRLVDITGRGDSLLQHVERLVANHRVDPAGDEAR